MDPLSNKPATQRAAMTPTSNGEPDLSTAEPSGTAERRVRRSQAERRTDAQERLIDSAISLIAERGLQRTSLADIGERAGLSRSMAAHHFGDKQGILRVLAKRIRSDFRSGLEKAGVSGHEGLKRILETIDVYVRANAIKPERAHAVYFMFAEALMLGGELKAEMQVFNEETLQTFETQIRRGIELGEIRADVDPKTHAVIIVGMIRGVIGQYAYGRERINLDVIRKQILENVRRSLAAEGPGSAPF